MSDSADTTPSPPAHSANEPKRKRMSNACDRCRRRRAKCDSQKFADQQCTSCRTHKIPCTHEMPTMRPGVKQLTQRVEELVQRNKELEALLERAETKLLNSQKNNSTSTSANRADPLSQLIAAQNDSITQMIPVHDSDPVAQITAAHEHSPELDLEQTDPEYIKMVDDLQKFNISDIGFAGPSSNLYFAHQMMGTSGAQDARGSLHRPALHSWEEESTRREAFSFPEDDLIQSLIDIFFNFRSIYVSPLHEPTFRRDVLSGLHHINSSFGAVVLMVCAVAARMSPDPRVILEGTSSKHSAGWKWASQVATRFYLFEKPNIYDVQYCCLLSVYMLSSSNPHAVWGIIGVGMRFVIEMGLHRRRDEKPTAESELRKRVFWTVYIIDRAVCVCSGRPFTISDDEFDTEYPISCDDEYWNTGNPATDFKQPPGLPSKMDAFIWMIKLNQIMSFSLRTIFNGIRKSKESSRTPNWIQNHLALVDSMLNSWHGIFLFTEFNSVPAHFHWNSDGMTAEFRQQSTELFAMYYCFQIFLHRPFVYTSSPVALPSLVICTSAARSGIRIMMVHQGEMAVMLSLLTNLLCFTAGSAILMNMWHGFRAGRPMTERDLSDFQHCLDTLDLLSVRLNMPNRFLDTLHAMAKGLPLNLKRNPHLDFPPVPDPLAYASQATIPSGYMANGSDMVLDFDLDSFGVMQAESDLLSQWNGYSQADMSLVEDMSAWFGLPGSSDPLPQAPEMPQSAAMYAQ